MTLEAIFLGQNNAGEKVYNWLNQRDDVLVKALLTEKNQLSLIKEVNPDIVISCGFEYKVPEEIIEIPNKGTINLHPSFLPYNRGANPQVWAIVENTPAGVSIHYMNEEIDEGAVIDRREVMVKPDDTARVLYDRLAEEQFEQFKDLWPEIKQGLDGREQDLNRGNVHYRNEFDEICQLDLDERVNVGDFLDRLRGLTFPPYQTAYFEVNGKKYFVEVSITPEDEF